MGHAALSTSAHLLAGGRVLPSLADDPSSTVADTGLDLGFPWGGWCPDGLTEPVIDHRYGDLLDDLDGPDEPLDGGGESRLLAFPPRQPMVVSAGQGGEAA